MTDVVRGSRRIFSTAACLLYLVAVVSALVLASPARAAQVFLFPSLTASERSSAGPELDEAFVPALDVFLAANGKRWRFLAEGVVSSAEQELERFQLGRQLGTFRVLWLGRYHTPLGIWNTEYHHADFLQPTISRPGFIEFEDDGGPLPAHLTGLLLEGTINQETRTLDYSIGIAEGPVLEGVLEPVDLLDPSFDGRLAVVGRLGWTAVKSELHAGFYGGALDIPVLGRELRSVRQSLFGVYLYRTEGAVSFASEVFSGWNRLEEPSRNRSDFFVGGYFQAMAELGPWAPFARLERTDGVDDGSYLELFPDFVQDRALVGLRRLLPADQALKVEASRLRNPGTEFFFQIEAQWSLMLAF